MQRKDNESYLSYVRRVTEACSDKRITYSEWGDCVLGVDNVYSSDNLRKAFYCVSKMLNNIDTDVVSDNVFEELETLREEIYKERCKLSDANREKNKYLREQSRTEMIVEEMKYLIDNMKPFSYNKCDYKYGTDLEASLLVSDLHYGLTVDNVVNFYDESICEERLNQLRDKTIERCKAHKVDKLNVCILGDDISGLIHFSTIAENNRDVITQCIEVSELLSNFVLQLNEEIPEVKVYTTYGNHSRAWQGKSNGSNKENYERIVAEFLKTRLKPYGIKVIDGGWEDFIVTEIAGKKIVMTHGDKDSLTQASANFAKLLGERVDEIYMAHLHAHREFDDCNTQVIINGSLVSTDDYALSLRKHTNAVQLLRIYGEDVCCYRLKLD